MVAANTSCENEQPDEENQSCGKIRKRKQARRGRGNRNKWSKFENQKKRELGKY